MKLKLKAGLENVVIFVPFENRNVLGKFIDPGLYPYLNRIAPDLFELVSDVKNTNNNDILINDTKLTSGSNTKGEGI